jgi:[ribosomal protein S18]-alanine N-acetyltransferase
VTLRPLPPQALPAALAIEQRAYSHPWTAANFNDSWAAGHRIEGVFTAEEQLLGYSACMRGADEVHLLNITVAPEHQGQGHAQTLLRSLCAWGQSQQLHWLWLEVRASNTRALKLYERFGLERVGLRKGYYPQSHTSREDAVVMSFELARLAATYPAPAGVAA